jgi:membrane protein CcdC involved in cytochrome C biogenesis
MTHSPQQWMSTLIPILIVAIVLVLRLRRMNRASRLRLERLWILPALYALIVGFIFWSHPPHGLTWAYVLAAFLIGVPLGWYRGKLMRITIDPETHALSQKASPAALLFIVALVGLRFVARGWAMADGDGGPDAIFALTDILMAFALGFLATQRLEMGLRARGLLDQAQGRVR